MSVRSVEDWIGILKPLGYWDAADAILDDLDDYPKRGGELRNLLNAHREDDKKQLGNALIAWAMLTAIEIEAELGAASPEQEHTPTGLWNAPASKGLHSSGEHGVVCGPTSHRKNGVVAVASKAE